MASLTPGAQSVSQAWTTPVTRSHRPVALVFSDDLSIDLGALTRQRCTAALPFAGRYRVIDFALSNCVNSGIERVGVITMRESHTLQSHVAHGRPWDLDRHEGGLSFLHPYQACTDVGWYVGTADALFQNQGFIAHHRPEQVLVLWGSQVSIMDLGMLSVQHQRARADLTVAVVAAANGEVRCHPTLIADEEGWVQQLVPPGAPHSGSCVLLGVMLFSADVLNWRLSEDAQRTDSSHDMIHDVIPRMIEAGDRVMSVKHGGFWSRLLSVYDYWRANMDLLSDSPKLNLHDAAWPIRTQSTACPPTRLSTGARVSHSLLSEGCVIDGTVEYSILSPGVYVGPGAVVRSSIMMHDVAIEERATVENAIVDVNATVGTQARVGRKARHAPALDQPARELLAVVEAGARIPGHKVIEPVSQLDAWAMSVASEDTPSTPTDADILHPHS